MYAACRALVANWRLVIFDVSCCAELARCESLVADESLRNSYLF